MAASFHVVMFPWFALGHMTILLKLANKLAENGYRVSFLIPTKTLTKLSHLNLNPHLIQFTPLTLPHVDGLPLDAETTADLGENQLPLLLRALDLAQDKVETALAKLQPHLIIFDFVQHWIPSVAQRLGIKSISFCNTSAVSGVVLVPKMCKQREEYTELDLIQPPEVFPGESSTKPLLNEYKFPTVECDDQIPLGLRIITSMRGCEALYYNTCTELEGPFLDYISKQYSKKILLTGPFLGKSSNSSPLEEKWSTWLSGFRKGSVVYCSFGSECTLERDQFQELVIGLELTGLPFLARLTPPYGAKTVEEGLPEGFEERVRGRGVVHGGWVQQQQILSHPSVGCFINHAGTGAMWEALESTCQLVFIANAGDQFRNTRFMSKSLKIGVAVERREEDGWFSKENVCEAVKLLMDEGSEVGEKVRANHREWNKLLFSEALASSYMNNFITELQDMVK